MGHDAGRTAGEPLWLRSFRANNAGAFALDGTTTFVLGRERVAVVDPGPHEEAHLAQLASAVAGARDGVILLTHGHPDHSAGAEPLARRTGFVVRAAAAGSLEDGDRIATDAGTLRVIATPGHARDHVVLHLIEAGVVFVGDLLLGRGETTWVGEYPGCVDDYLRSLDRLEAVGARRLFPAHGPPIDDPPSAIGRYRRHRLERVEQVRAALAGAGSALDPSSDEGVHRLVSMVYGGSLPPALREGAAWSVRAILDRLGAAPFPPQGAPTEDGDRLAPPS